jgi:phenylacetate-CoA ligase
VLLRYLTGDVTAIVRDRCPHCDRVGERVLRPPTRISELLKIKGMLVNLTALKDALTTVPDLVDFQVVVETQEAADPYSRDVLRLRYVPSATASSALVTRLEQLIGEGTGVRPLLEEIPTTTELFGPAGFKVPRVVDRRSIAGETAS